MNTKQVVLTPEGLSKIQNQLKYLKTVKRREIAERLKEAIGFGDISENSEYDDAKNEQALIEGRIMQLEQLLANVHVTDSDALSTDEIGLGTTVRLKDLETNEEFEYKIVSFAEVDLAAGKISNASPVGKALLGKVVGDVVSIQVPIGVLTYEIVSISKQEF
jgi:transcription elongation factor GreA